MFRTQLAALRRLLKVTPANTVAMRRRLAEATVAKGGYPFKMRSLERSADDPLIAQVLPAHALRNRRAPKFHDLQIGKTH